MSVWDDTDVPSGGVWSALGEWAFLIGLPAIVAPLVLAAAWAGVRPGVGIPVGVMLAVVLWVALLAALDGLARKRSQ